MMISLKPPSSISGGGSLSVKPTNITLEEAQVYGKRIVIGYDRSMVLKDDGTVVCWGNNDYGQCNVPKELSNVVAIAAGEWHSLALKKDGSVVCWGGQCALPKDFRL